MAFLDTYRQQVVLLIRVLPLVAEERAFALKGGTAINLFVRNMPHLSVDIDLTYLPVEDRFASLATIDAARCACHDALAPLDAGCTAARPVSRSGADAIRRVRP